MRFAQRLNEMSDELATLAKEVDKNRKQVRLIHYYSPVVILKYHLLSVQTKDLASRYERALQESEGITDKSKTRLDMTSEELERVLLAKEGESFKDNTVQTRPSGAGGKRVIGKAVAKGGLLLKGKNPGNVGSLKPDYISHSMASSRFNVRKMISEQGCPVPPMLSERL